MMHSVEGVKTDSKSVSEGRAGIVSASTPALLLISL